MRTNRLGLGLTVLATLLTAVLYPRLPDAMPSHFDIHGQVDGWMRKPMGAFWLPASMLAMWLLLAWLSRRARSEEPVAAPRVLEVVSTSLIGFLFLTHAVVLRVALGGAVDVNRVLFVALGLMLAILGNYFGKIRRNRWLGIRTPWTLADDEVWARTHRMAGPIFVAGGLFVALCALTGKIAVGLIALLVIPLFPIVYSYRLAQKR